jgi:hypothetical protein
MIANVFQLGVKPSLPVIGGKPRPIPNISPKSAASCRGRRWNISDNSRGHALHLMSDYRRRGDQTLFLASTMAARDVCVSRFYLDRQSMKAAPSKVISAVMALLNMGISNHFLQR